MFTPNFSILDVLFPKFCFNCRSIGTYLCDVCKQKLLPATYDICPYCEKKSGYGLTHGVCARIYGLDGMLNVFYYDDVFKKILKAIKFRRIKGGVSVLIDSIPKEFWNKLITTSEIFYNDAEVLAVPLHPKRLRERGFNQSDILAQACAIMMQKNNAPIIKRLRNTRPQSQLSSAAERYLNIHNAFTINSADKLPKKIIVVDDVWTTGATIREIAHTLKYAGVERVYALTFARRAHAQFT